ncbi:MAG: hypothetical protein A2Y25_00670 [Candidatus Melainabacteria bacterium GWF2_37_15]|nr:MAG: hypothetical protein A2Y25_00670 [Candidatus Melainabacteria bacterium GWF2_37_15]
MPNLLSPTGKLTRKPYVIIILSLLFIMHFYDKAPTENLAINIIILLLLLVVYIFTIIKRLKDIGWSRLFIILTFIPFISYIFLLILAFEKSNSGVEKVKQSFSWENFKNQIFGISTIGFYIMYFIYGIVQFSAIYSGANAIFNNGIIAFIIAGFICYIPLIGTCVGIYGAHIGWEMSWASSFLLFFAPYLLIGSFFLIGLLIDKVSTWQHQHD